MILVSIRLPFFHQYGQLATGFRAIASIKPLAHPHDKIMRRQGFFVPAEPFPDDALHVIAPVGPFGGFFADHQAQPGMPQTVVCRL